VENAPEKKAFTPLAVVSRQSFDWQTAVSDSVADPSLPNA
jgi:hypothetical protein